MPVHITLGKHHFQFYSVISHNTRTMKQKCCYAESGRYNTDGSPVMVRVCYCGTSACMELATWDYPLPKDYKQIVDVKTELSPEEEKKFYEKVMKTNLIN